MFLCTTCVERISKDFTFAERSYTPLPIHRCHRCGEGLGENGRGVFGDTFRVIRTRVADEHQHPPPAP